MADYRAPIQDMHFLLNEVFQLPRKWQDMAGIDSSIDAQMAESILQEAAKMSEQVLAPINQSGDEEGVQFHEGRVTTPQGFKEAYQCYADGGWVGLSGNTAYGGMGMPSTIEILVQEMIASGNVAFSMYPGLTAGACLAINSHASESLKARFLEKMYSGQWSGTMCLTEPHAGSDLGIIRSKAVPQDDATYLISGTKIFITAGEHDLTENIIHLVLARLPEAPSGVKGISLFLVPKLLVKDDGSLAGNNGVSCASTEHKMGIHASATCVMNFDQSKGYLIGEPNRGLSCMFTMMNHERLVIGIQGLSCAESSYQNARNYAQERLQGRSKAKISGKNIDPIIVHADIRRMLMNMKAMNEASRAFAVYVAEQLDLEHFSDVADQRKKASTLVALLTPVAKAFITDSGFDACVAGQQIFGGHGYIRESGQEQWVRDVRISQIYEGTNGIQAMDLIERKIAYNNGQFLECFIDEIRQFIENEQSRQTMMEFLNPLSHAIDELGSIAQWILSAADDNPNELGAAAVEYLHVFGYTAYAYMWARMAAIAIDKSSESFYQNKLSTARYYMLRILPRTQSLIRSIKSGSDVMYQLPANQF